MEKLPGEMVDGAIQAAYPFSFTKVSFNEVMLEHAPKEMKETQKSSGGSPSDSIDEKANRMPSPVMHGAEHSLKEGAELPIEETIEESKEQNQEPQLSQSQNQEAREEHQGQQTAATIVGGSQTSSKCESC